MEQQSWKPVLLKTTVEDGRAQVEELRDSSVRVVDTYADQLQELFAIENPSFVFDGTLEEKFSSYRAARSADLPEHDQGVWVHYPWLNLLVHVLDEHEFFTVRTARNRNLITSEEQEQYYNAVVGVGGLSIGNSVALAIVLSGGARRMKLADFDTLDLSNLNRIRTGIDELGMRKAEITARQIYLINPYAEIEIFSNGLTSENISDFINGLSVVVDELDNLAVKCLLREEARKKRIPVVMAADCADNAVIDIERYDLDAAIQPFHGRLGDVSYESLSGLDKRATGRLIAKLVGLENHNEAMLRSLQALGKTLASWPQLGSTALINGSALAYCVRRIVTKQPIIDNRAVLSFDALLDATFNSETATRERRVVIAEFEKILGL